MANCFFYLEQQLRLMQATIGTVSQNGRGHRGSATWECAINMDEFMNLSGS